MPFKKGQPKVPGSGRTKGTLNKASILRVQDVLAQKGLNPVEEVLKLMPKLAEAQRVKAWLELLSYCQAKPRDPGDGEGELPAAGVLPPEVIAALLKAAG